MNIPSHIPKLTYTKHALAERCKEPRGFIAAAPMAFYRVGCKDCWELDKPNLFRAVYVYDDLRDLHLVIDATNSTVITNYLKPANNKGVYKGRFRIGHQA